MSSPPACHESKDFSLPFPQVVGTSSVAASTELLNCSFKGLLADFWRCLRECLDVKRSSVEALLHLQGTC